MLSFHKYKELSLTPKSFAIAGTLLPPAKTSRTASRLNASSYRLPLLPRISLPLLSYPIITDITCPLFWGKSTDILGKIFLVKLDYWDSSQRGVWNLTEKGFKAELNEDTLHKDLKELKRKRHQERKKAKDEQPIDNYESKEDKQ